MTRLQDVETIAHDDSRLTTSGGSVVISMPENLRVNLDAEVSGGHVETDIPVALTASLSPQGKVDGSKLKGAINGGGAMLFLRASGSSIRVRKSVVR
jgi:hypothetical protein